MIRIVLLLSIAMASCQGPATTSPQTKNVVEAVYASGHVVADQEHQIFSQTEGVIQEILVPEGKSVAAGTPILILQSEQQDARLSLAREAVAIARKNASAQSPILSELNASLRSAISKRTLDSVNFVRYSNLLQSKATTAAEFDRMRLVYEHSKNECTALQSRLARTKNDLSLALEQAESQWRIAQEDSRNFQIQTAVDGMVFKIAKKKGELVRRSELVAVVGKKGQFHLQLSVDELDIQRIKEGQLVKVRMDAYPGKIFEGVVTHIYPLVDTRQQSLQVDASLTQELPGLFSGLAVEANIIIREKANAVVIAKSLLLSGDSVWVLTDSGKEKVSVEKGMETLDEVEIISGIDSNSRLVSGN